MTAAPGRKSAAASGVWRDLALNFRPSMISFLLMRITGVALVVYLFLHIWTVGAVRRVAAGETAAEAFDRSIAAWNTRFGHFIEFLLLACVLAHAANGLRLVLADWFHLTAAQRKMLWGAVVGVIVILAIAAPVFFPYWFGG